MKYIVRALRYYLSILILLAVILFVLAKLGYVESDLSTMFKDGYDSLWKIALILAVFSAVYPKLGYSTRSVRAAGSFSDFRGTVLEYMDEKGYRLKKEEDEKMVFVLRSPIRRLLKMFSDELVFTKDMVGFTIDGLTKDIVRIGSGLENRLNPLP